MHKTHSLRLLTNNYETPTNGREDILVQAVGLVNALFTMLNSSCILELSKREWFSRVVNPREYLVGERSIFSRLAIDASDNGVVNCIWGSWKPTQSQYKDPPLPVT